MKRLSKLSARLVYGVALALLFGATPYALSHPSIASSYLKAPNLEGMWEINREKSDDPQNKMREAISRRLGGGLRDGRSSGGGGGGLPNGDGFPGGPPPGDSPEQPNSPSGKQVGNISAKIEERTRAAEVLEIFQTESEITVNETGDDRLVNTQTFYTDGRTTYQETEYGKLETNAKWRGNKLVVQTRSNHGGRMTRTYELGSDGRELYVTLKMQNEKMPQAISIRSVYDKSQ